MVASGPNYTFLFELHAQRGPHACGGFDFRGKQMGGGDDGRQVRDKILAGSATGEMRARHFRHGHKTLLLEDDFYFFTLHGRVLRDTRLRKLLRLDSEYDLAPCLRLFRAPRNFAYCNSIAVSP